MSDAARGSMLNVLGTVRCSAWRLVPGMLALIAALMSAPVPAWAQDRIVVADARLRMAADVPDPGIVLDADFDFDLPWVLEDAVNRGIALYFVVEFELYRKRWYWFDRKLVSTSLTYRLTYSPLTRQYRLAQGTLALPVETLGEALGPLRRIRGWTVIDLGTLQPDESYRAQVRMRLDTSQLPKPFQINALTNRDWTLASDWHEIAVPIDLAR